jgi:YhcH/YjgK/YiaL family protein
MIFAPITEWRCYLQHPDLIASMPEIERLISSGKEGEAPVLGSDIFVKVLKYETKTGDFVTESHRVYRDIQIVTHGVEGIEVMSPEVLEISRPYQAADDCVFYAPTPAGSGTRITLVPGWFALFHPHDAHKTQIAGHEGPAQIRKIVVKVHEKFFT